MSEKPLSMVDDLPADLKASMLKLRDNLLICMIKRAGGKVQFPVPEVDAADDMLTMEVDDTPAGKVFTVQTRRRQ
jgi:hypothetical protein